ncbi:DUF3108 domain-containing protein [Deefgea rivuli]|uniref:DUF3108 domain-containing protein n=1 Tax=Deefgea rivuli TaxID=400948 RepID=UPI0004837F25|nr:DUF3108 domain-containing protein [Deefgea rivuli]
MKYLRWFIWFALIASILVHLIALLAEPIYAWLTQPEFAQTELKKTDRKLAEQSLDEEETPAELVNVKPAEKQVVFLQAVQPKVVRPKAVPKKLALKPNTEASAVKSVQERVAPEENAQLQIAATPEPSRSVTAEMEAAAALSRISTSSSAAQAVAVQASSASAVKARIATQIDTEASKRFPKVVEIGYYYAVFDARITWKIENNQYEMQLKASPAGKKVDFVSEGEINARNGVKPLRFADLSPGVDKPPKNEVVFNWDSDTAIVGPPNDKKTESIEPGDQDLLSAALHLALMGSKHPTYAMSLFSGKKRYPDVVFELKGEATLTLGQEKVDAVLMRAKWGDRQVDFWLAPQWNNLPIKMSVNLGKDGSYEITAKSVTLDGRKVLEWVAPRDQQHRRP